MAAIKKTKGDCIFDIINCTVLSIIVLTVLFPLYFIVIASFSDPSYVSAGQLWLLPKGPTFEGYQRILNDRNIWIGYRNTIYYTVTATTISVFCTLTAAYALSRKDLKGSGVIMRLLVFTMLFNGGLIPRYMLIKDLGLINTSLSMILPMAVGAYNLIIARTFFQSTIPDELFEAAVIDGCNNTRFFFSIVMPLSSALTAVLVLFYGVQNWNSFFDALMFLRDSNLFPLQLILREILIQSQQQANMTSDITSLEEAMRKAEQIKYGVIIVASLPVLVLYPALQKYFVKGVMIGAIKG